MHRLSVAVVAIAGLCALAGCGTSGAASPVAGGAAATTAASPAATATPASPSAAAPASRVIDERDNGRVVRVAAGSAVIVVLHSTYWHFGAPPAGAVLAEIGLPSPAPSPPGTGGCMPGMGCGTVTAVFHAVGVGTAVVRASRISCGEALRCRASQGRFVVTIVVAA